MEQLPQTYLAQIASQMGFLSAFLGGVAATLLALLLDDKPHRRVVTWAVGLAAAAAVAFIIAVVCSTMLVSVLHPDAPDHLVRQASINRARAFRVDPLAADRNRDDRRLGVRGLHGHLGGVRLLEPR